MRQLCASGLVLPPTMLEGEAVTHRVLTLSCGVRICSLSALLTAVSYLTTCSQRTAGQRAATAASPTLVERQLWAVPDGSQKHLNGRAALPPRSGL